MAELDPVQTVSSKVVYKNPWITVHEDQTILPSGKPGLYGYLEPSNSVMGILLDDNDEVCLINAFRYPTGRYGWEFPAGAIDGEEPVEAVRREIAEETGISAGQIELLGNVSVCNGLSTEQKTVFVLTDLDVSGKADRGDEAIDEQRFMSVGVVDQLVNTGEINDGQTITALYFLQRWLKQKGQQ